MTVLVSPDPRAETLIAEETPPTLIRSSEYSKREQEAYQGAALLVDVEMYQACKQSIPIEVGHAECLVGVI